MSSLWQKIKDVFSRNKHQRSSKSTNARTRDSNVANNADSRVDNDYDGRAAQGTTGTTAGTTAGTNAGVNNTNLGSGNQYDTAGSTSAGPYSSNTTNNPRVDGDYGGRAAHSNSGYGTTGVNAGNTTGNTAAQNTYNSASYSNVSPQNTSMPSKTDNRASSNRDYYQTAPSGMTDTTGPSTGTGAMGASTNTTTAGLQNSSAAGGTNPRVDSDYSNRGATTSLPTSQDYNTHNANAGTSYTDASKKTDSQIASDIYNHVSQQQMGSTTAAPAGSSYATTGTGQTRTSTTGPHKSSLLNKLDPRVHSDLDGNRTVGTTQR